ncbi:MAG: autotransporter domain-containing protein [Syntrophobacter sp.]
MKKSGPWAEGFARFVESSVDGFRDFDYGMQGVGLGFDSAVTERLVAGFDLGFANTALDLAATSGRNSIASYFVSLHGACFTGTASFPMAGISTTRTAR